MSSSSDRAYWERRALEERDKAERADDPASYRIHTEFARAYERRMQNLDGALAQSSADPVALNP